MLASATIVSPLAPVRVIVAMLVLGSVSFVIVNSLVVVTPSLLTSNVILSPVTTLFGTFITSEVWRSSPSFELSSLVIDVFKSASSPK